MENLAPPLGLVLELRRALENGEGLRSGALRFALVDKNSLGRSVLEWIQSREKGLSVQNILDRQPNIYRRAVLETMAAGLDGQPVHQRLVELQKEIENACDLEIKAKLELLPFLALIPMMLFQVPALLLVMLGPLIHSILKEF